MRISEYGGEQDPPAAADVDHGADIGEVVAGGHRRGECGGSLQHRGIEDGCVLGMLCQEVEERRRIRRSVQLSGPFASRSAMPSSVTA